MEMNKKSTNLGGAREGAGRKRELPEGVKVTSFKLTEAERIAVKNFIQEMRGGNNSKKMEEAEKEKQAFDIMVEASKPVAKALLKIINLYGGRGKGFRKAEEYGKMIAIGASKDAVQMWENENPRQ